MNIKLRKESEIKEKLRNYENHYHLIKSTQGKKNIDFAICELRWVLGGDGK